MTTQTLTLTDFLLARLAEDEASDMGMPHGSACRLSGGFPGMPETAMPCDCGVTARVLAECEAKRRIVERCGQMAQYLFDEPDEEWTEAVHLAADAVRALASVHADHPDYREEWA